MAAKKDKMIPSEKERKRALKYATPAGTGRMWVTMGIAFIIFGIILLLYKAALAGGWKFSSCKHWILNNNFLGARHSLIKELPRKR